MILALLPRLTSGLDNAVTRLDGEAVRAVGAQLLLLGVVIGLLSVAAVWRPLAALTPAGVMLAVYAPLYASLVMPTWYPDWLTRLALESAGPVPPLIAGVLLGAAAVPTATRAVRKATDRRAVLLDNRSA